MKYVIYKPSMKMKKNFLVAPNYFWSSDILELNPNAFKILHYFIKYTYGFHKDENSVGIEQIARDCKMSKKTASKSVNILLKYGLLEITREANRFQHITRAYKLFHGYMITKTA